MKSWYQSHHIIKYIFFQAIVILFFYIEVLRYGQNQDISYMFRYLEGIYVFFLILTFTMQSHHQNIHMMFYMGKRVQSVFIKHIVSDVWTIVYMLGIIMTQASLLIILQLPVLYMQLQIIITIQYTVLTNIIFQMSDHFFIRLSFQMMTYMLFIYAESIKILKPFIWFEKYHIESNNIVYAMIIIFILMVIRFIKYHFIRVRP